MAFFALFCFHKSYKNDKSRKKMNAKECIVLLGLISGQKLKKERCVQNAKELSAQPCSFVKRDGSDLLTVALL